MRYDLSLKQQLIQEYVEGKDSRELSEIYGINQATITYWLRAAKVSRHRGPKSKILREDYFDIIDTEQKAYWLGWIMADGNVSCYKGQFSLKLHISIKDKIMIDRFLQEIGSTNKPKEKYGSAHSYYVSLTSRHMVEKLFTYGIVPRKTGKECLPDISKELTPHFIRGYFDGDGITDSISSNKYRSGFVSSESLLLSFQLELGTNYTIFQNGGAHYFLGGKKFSKKLYDYMYSSATIWLPRKRDKLKIICGNTEVTD